MAFETIKTQVFGETTYAEQAGANNLKRFPGGKYWYEIVVKQNINTLDYTSDFIVELWTHLEPDEYIEGITYDIQDEWGEYVSIDVARRKGNGEIKASGDGSYGRISALMVSLNTATDTLTNSSGSLSYSQLKGYHDVNGVFSVFEYKRGSTTSTSSFNDNLLNVNVLGEAYIQAYYYDEVGEQKDYREIVRDTLARSSVDVEPLTINKGVVASAANDFTDETSASFTYAARNLKHAMADTTTISISDGYILTDKITSLQVALSLDGVSPNLIGYRDIPVDGTSYTFNFTDQDRVNIQTLVQGSSVVPVYYLIKTVREVSITGLTQSAEHITATKRTLTIAGCNPALNPTVKDIKPETLALTGNENTFIRYESVAEYEINAVASKNATIVSQSVQCGSEIIRDLPQGIIDDVESGEFVFTVVDSRNMAAVSSVFKNLIEYVKPTCNQKVEVALSAETGTDINLTVSGSYFNGSFGVSNNSLLLEVRYTNDDGEMGDWIRLSGTPTFRDNTYELETTFSGFDYGQGYVFQCRATDKLNFVESSQYTIKLLPVFDWGENDFNFNVPVNIEADTLDIHGQTVLRQNAGSTNTVLSAPGGHVYIRPNGSNSTYGETILYSNGDVKFYGGAEFGGSVNFESFTIDGNTLADYVIETGQEAMGSNGTWYWQKWASGKSECWGCRNFGNMAVNTAWGNLYRSAIFTQDLPDNVFLTTPDVININIVNSNFGGWICKHENQAPSAITTGAFIFVRPASATVSPTYIGFHIIGLWKY